MSYTAYLFLKIGGMALLCAAMALLVYWITKPKV